MQPLVSIITPAYNSEKYIAEAIESVLQQSYRNWEMIIVNDASIDNTAAVVQKYIAKDPRIKVIHNSQNLGVAKSRNIALEAAKGDYIAFLDSDDFWHKSKLQKQIEFMRANNLVLTYSAFITIKEDGSYNNSRIPPKEISYKDLLRSNHIGTSTGVYDRNYFGKVTFCDTGHEDYLFWLGLLQKITKTKGLLEPLSYYRIVSGSLSSNKLKALMWQWRIYRKFQKLSISKSLYYTLCYIYYGLKKRV